MRLRLAVATMLWAAAAAAQPEPPPATLVADAIRIEGEGRLIAEGDVEILYDGRRLNAARVIYDRTSDRVSIEGPIQLLDGADIILLADAADIDTDLRDGLLTGARLVLDRQLQLAATEISRTEGRFTELSRVVASSCEVCAARPTPLWEIRARRVVHDEARKMLTFEGATFRLYGVPVARIPRLRLPDPTNERARGVLAPSVRTSSLLGPGAKLPYFLPLGRSVDVTLTPYLGLETRTLEGRYRHAFRSGELSFEGAVSNDDTGVEQPRAYLFGSAYFDLPRDFVLRFDAETVTDPAYLSDYGYSDADRLSSTAALSRTVRDSFFLARATDFETLRPSELPIQDTLPDLYADTQFSKTYAKSVLGGDIRLGFDGAAVVRRSDEPGPGRDVARVGAELDWRRQGVLGPGLVAGAAAGLELDAYDVVHDPAFDDVAGRATPRLATSLRWPLARSHPGGAREVIEPAIQIVWQRPFDEAVPNEDSRIVTLDEGNLQAFSRFPGDDRIETGAHVDLAISWRRFAPAWGTTGVTIGRIARFDGADQFDPRTGLGGTWSDWLLAGDVDMRGGVRLAGRTLVGREGSPTETALQAAYDGEGGSVLASYVFGVPTSDEPDDTRISELALDAGVDIDRNWSASVDGRFDFEADRAQRAGLGVTYANECIRVGLSLSRRFTSSSNVSATTDAGLTVALTGFGDDPRSRGRRSCGL